MGFLKSRKRSKWYACFRPERHEDYPFEPVPCLETGGKESNIYMLRDNILMALPDDDKLGSSSDGDDRLSKESKSRRSLSRAFKAVLFPTSLAKKNRSRKSDQEKSFRSNSSSVSSKLDRVLNSFRGNKSSSPLKYKDTFDCSLGTDSSGGSSIFSSSVTPASSSLSSSRASSIASNSRSASERKKSIAIDFKQLEKKPSTVYTRKSSNGCCNPILGLYFLLLCLVALVSCGKALAVFCTLTCLFLVPCRFKRVDQTSSVHNNVDSIDVDSDEYKKKVIMEGLLERNRTTRVL